MLLGTSETHKHIEPKLDDLVYTKSQSNARYLGKNATANDSDKIDGLDSTDFATSHVETWHVVGQPSEPIRTSRCL